jgi:hypothetical protein
VLVGEALDCLRIADRPGHVGDLLQQFAIFRVEHPH